MTRLDHTCWHSPTGNRTRVVWVKTTYPDQLDYRGSAPAGNQTRVSSVAGTYTITVLPAHVLDSETGNRTLGICVTGRDVTNYTISDEGRAAWLAALGAFADFGKKKILQSLFGMYLFRRRFAPQPLECSQGPERPGRKRGSESLYS